MNPPSSAPTKTTGDAARGIALHTITFYERDGQLYPLAARTSPLDNVDLSFLRSNFPPEPGAFWDKDTEFQATVKTWWP